MSLGTVPRCSRLGECTRIFWDGAPCTPAPPGRNGKPIRPGRISLLRSSRGRVHHLVAHRARAVERPPLLTSSLMSPEQAAAFLRSQADAVLAAAVSVSVRLELRSLDSSALSLSSTERGQRKRARDRLENATKRNGGDAVPLELPSDRNGETPDELSVGKASELQKNPDQNQGLSESTGACARGETGANETQRSSARVASNVVTGTRAGSSWRCFPLDYVPDDAMRSFAASLNVDLDAELAKIRDWEFARPHRDPAKTLRTWLRNAAERGPTRPRASPGAGNGHSGGAPRPSLFDIAKLRAAERSS